MIRRAGLLVIMCVSLFGVEPAAANGCSKPVWGTNGVGSTCAHVGWTFDKEKKRFVQKPIVTASDDPDGSKYIYTAVAACDASVNAGGGNSICSNFGNCPPRTAPDGTPMRADLMRGLRAPRGPSGEPVGEMLPFGEPICLYTGREIPMAEVVAAVREQLVKEVGRPEISMWPATRGLIRWPVVFSAPAQHQVRLNITQPLPGDITADPSYSWNLGDGQRATGAGHRYSSAVDPTSSRSDDYYVKGTYEQPGRHPVRLTLTWSATIHLGDLDVDLDPIVFTDDASATVVSATNRLYAGPATS
jgi:hypothetical protein